MGEFGLEDVGVRSGPPGRCPLPVQPEWLCRRIRARACSRLVSRGRAQRGQPTPTGNFETFDNKLFLDWTIPIIVGATGVINKNFIKNAAKIDQRNQISPTQLQRIATETVTNSWGENREGNKRTPARARGRGQFWKTNLENPGECGGTTGATPGNNKRKAP